MAYYPLKIKDGSGNVHTVGDPRTSSKVDTTDARLSNARTPTAHAASHGSGGSDPITVANTQVTGLGTASTKNTPASGNASSTEVVLGADTRLSDSRTPTDASVTDAKVASGAAIAQSKIANLTTDLAGKAATSHTHTSSAVPTVDLNTQSASYTLVLADAGKAVLMGSASAQTVTIPPNSSVAFAVGTKIDIVQTGAGQCDVAPGAGVTLNSDTVKRKVNVQYAAVSIVKTATDTWLLIGALKA